MSGGWFLVHRKMRECEFFAAYPKREIDEYGAWLWIIEHAAWKDTTRSASSGERIAITRGQLHTSLRALQTAWKWEKHRVERFLNRLVEWEMIRMESGKSGRILSVCNYEAYQHGLDTDQEVVAKQERSSSDTQEITKEGKEGKEKKKWELPDWIDADAWADWEAQRKALKKPLTDQARKLCVGVLEKARAEGFTVRETIDLAISNGWQGLFVPKGKPAASSRPNMSWKEAQARVNELHSNMSWWNQCMKKAREQNNQEDFDKYSGFYLKCREERQSLEKAFNITSTWS